MIVRATSTKGTAIAELAKCLDTMPMGLLRSGIRNSFRKRMPRPETVRDASGFR